MLARDYLASRPWLDAELALIDPDIAVALGATSAQLLMGPAFRVTRERGRPFEAVPWARVFFTTVHPSSILRGPPVDRARNLALVIADLKKVAARPLFRARRAGS